MRRLIIISLLFVCGALVSCDIDGHLLIPFINTSEETIVFMFFRTSGLSDDDKKDLDKGKYPCPRRIPLIGLDPDSEFFIESIVFSYYSGWEGILENDTLEILCFDAKPYDEHIHDPCDTIQKYMPLLYRYRLTIEDLNAMNWKVTYPPSE